MGWSRDALQLAAEAMRNLRAMSACDIEAALTQAEFTRIETEFEFHFADDHRAFLAEGLPVNRGLPPQQPGVIYTHPQPWPDWRHNDPDVIAAFLNWPVEGVLSRFVIGRRILALSCTNAARPWSLLVTDGHYLKGVFAG